MAHVLQMICVLRSSWCLMVRAAGRLRSAVQAVRTHASDFRLVHVLWDPLQACAAQWPLASSNASLGHLCDRMHLETLPPLYKRAKRHRRALTLRLEDLVSRDCVKDPGMCCHFAMPLHPCTHLQLVPVCWACAYAADPSLHAPTCTCQVRRKSSSASWRQLFKFLELPEKAAELTTIASRAINDLRLRERVYNRNAPTWVRTAIERNSTLTSTLRRLRSELEYPGAGFAM